MDDALPVRTVLPDGSELWVEARSLGGVQKTASREEQQFDRITRILQSVGSTVAATVASLDAEKASVEFGLELALESGELTALLAKGSAKSSMHVKLEWSRAKTPPAAAPPA